MKIETKAVIDAYNKGESMTAIAKAIDTHAMTIKRILEKNNIELRHDYIKKGSILVSDGEKLIEWAKAQGRLVTKKELANVLGRTRLSSSYFIKYPELGQYIQPHDQKETQEYSNILYNWLKENHIPYKPDDRTKLGVAVTALLLGKYNGEVALQLNMKPKYVSCKEHSERMLKKTERAKEEGIKLIFVSKDDFDVDLQTITDLL